MLSVSPDVDREGMVDVLMLARELGPARVELAVRGALAAGAIDGHAVELLARQTSSPPPVRKLQLDARLAEHDRPEPDLSDYDELLNTTRGAR